MKRPSLKYSSGMTLVEVVIALAITGLMVAAALAPGSVFRARTSFTGAIDGLVGKLHGIQNESAHAVTYRPCAGNTCANSQYVAFGKLVEFTSGSGLVRVSTLVADEDMTQRMAACQPQDIRLRDGVVFNGTNAAMVSVFNSSANRLFTAPTNYNKAGMNGAICTAPVAAAQDKKSLSDYVEALARRLSRAAMAASPPVSCAVGNTNNTCNVLVPTNYSIDNGTFIQTKNLSFRSTTSPLTATVTLTPADAGIIRRFDN